MIKTVEGIKYITVPEEKRGYCTGCEAEENLALCKELHVPYYCQDSKVIFKKKENTMKDINYKVICDTAYSILSTKLKKEVKHKYSIDYVEELISSEIKNIENDDVRNFVESLVVDATNNEKNELCVEVVNSAVEDFLRKMAGYYISGYDGIEKVSEVAKNILIAELTNTLIDEDYEELKEWLFDSVFEDITDSEILDSVKLIFSEANEKVIKKVVNDIIHRKVANFISDNFDVSVETGPPIK